MESLLDGQNATVYQLIFVLTMDQSILIRIIGKAFLENKKSLSFTDVYLTQSDFI
jgi:hypothetical protein